MHLGIKNLIEVTSSVVYCRYCSCSSHLRNPLLHGPMAIHVQNLDVRATRKSSNVTVYVAIAVTALFCVFWPIIKSPDVVTGGFRTPPP